MLSASDCTDDDRVLERRVTTFASSRTEDERRGAVLPFVAGQLVADASGQYRTVQRFIDLLDLWKTEAAALQVGIPCDTLAVWVWRPRAVDHERHDEDCLTAVLVLQPGSRRSPRSCLSAVNPVRGLENLDRAIGKLKRHFHLALSSAAGTAMPEGVCEMHAYEMRSIRVFGYHSPELPGPGLRAFCVYPRRGGRELVLAHWRRCLQKTREVLREMQATKTPHGYTGASELQHDGVVYLAITAGALADFTTLESEMNLALDRYESALSRL